MWRQASLNRDTGITQSEGEIHGRDCKEEGSDSEKP